MGEFKGTQGTWYVGDNGMDGPKPRYWIVTNEESWCDRVCSVPAYNDAKAVANSNLIAAAPDLLEALMKILSEYDSWKGYNDDGLEDETELYARAAIAKALGEQK